MNNYLTTLQEKAIQPNFWCSPDYFEEAQLEERRGNGWIWIWDPEAQVTVLPPIHETEGLVKPPPDMFPHIWSDFPGYFPGKPFQRKLLDLEYLYDPKDFQVMKGGKWSTFRKNCKKFPKRHEGSLLTYEPLKVPTFFSQCKTLFNRWKKGKSGEEIHEGHIMMGYLYSYLKNGYGKRRVKALMGDEKLLGINIWDENYHLINFRYCIHLNSRDHLGEYLRYLFYTDPEVLSKNKLINDGGVLDNPQLKAFKDKLNPNKVRTVYEWEAL